MNKDGFYKLIDKYLDGRANLEEEQQLLNFLDSFQDTPFAWDDRTLGVKESLEKKMLDRLLQTVRKGKQTKKINLFPYRKWKNIAASVAVLVISASLYLALHESPVRKEVKVAFQIKNDINSGGDRAILTLADGSTIELNDAQEGLLAEQGNTSIKILADGSLSYSPVGLIGKVNSSQINKISTPTGGLYQVTLPDGTKVWLNGTTSLEFPTEFIGNERNVKLSGEAYFEVAKFSLRGKSVPFYVNTTKSSIAVLGTHFNVKSYPDEDVQETTLLEGSVRIIGQSPGLEDSKVLTPGQQAKISSKYTDIKIDNDANTESVMGWKTGLFSFESAPIEEVMRKVQRWYGAEVIYQGVIPNVSFSGVLPRSEYASTLLKILESAGGVKFEIEGNKIIVKNSEIDKKQN